MASDIPLDPALVAELRTYPRHHAAVQLLTARGPLVDIGSPFPRDVGDVAYLLWLLHGAARRPKGMLAGRPSWEAADTFAARVRAAAPCARDLAGFGDVLCKRLNLRPETVFRGPDLLWWRDLCATDAATGIWRNVRRPDRLNECVVAVGLLRDWMWILRGEEAVEPEIEATPNTPAEEPAP
jgi:hypothetical protein